MHVSKTNFAQTSCVDLQTCDARALVQFDPVGVGKLGRSKLGLGNVGLGKLGSGKVGR